MRVNEEEEEEEYQGNEVLTQKMNELEGQCFQSHKLNELPLHIPTK
jgi:hypothetical protein